MKRGENDITCHVYNEARRAVENLCSANVTRKEVICVRQPMHLFVNRLGGVVARVSDFL